jgi:hypothetical protein
MYDTPDEQNVIQIVAHFREEVGSWYRRFKSNREHPSRQYLISLVKVRFSKPEEVSSYDEMKNLVQQGSLRSYMKQFEIVKSRSQVEFPYLPESHYVTAFISDLRDDIKHLVISKHHTSLLNAF